MERPDLIPHLTPKEKIDQKLEAHLAWIKERMAKVEEKMASSDSVSVTQNEEEKIAEQNKQSAPSITEVSKATGEYRERKLVMKDGEWIDEEFAEQ